MKFTENMLTEYAAPLNKTEREKCVNAIKMVRDALKELNFTDNGEAISTLHEGTNAYILEMRSNTGSRKVRIFLQGSYANDTAVRMESDVDIAVVQEDIFQAEYRTSTSGISQSGKDYGFITAPASDKSFKDEIEMCLKKKFGRDVERKNKSVKVHGNTYRKDADVVPCRRYRDYRQDYKKDANNYIKGIVILSDEGETIINYPEQHIYNGHVKNGETNGYYKKMVRIMKKMRYIMCERGYKEAEKVSSFGLESLLWNLPKEVFKKYVTYRFEFEEIVNYLYRNKQMLWLYKEANGIKSLCPTQEEVSNYSNFIDRLYSFYEYDI